MSKEGIKKRTENLTPGNYKHGFYFDGLLPCKECKYKKTCPNRDKFKDHRGTPRCLEEKNFFNEQERLIKEQFQLDDKDLFQLPQMIMIMIKLKRMMRYEAERGPVGSTLLFNPKTGVEHKMDTSNVLNRDTYYTQKALLAWFDSLKLSRSSRNATEGADYLLKFMKA